MKIPEIYLKQIRQYAIEHYEEDGWDYLIEAIDNADIQAQVDDHFGKPEVTYDELFKFIHDWVKMLDSHRRDIQGTAF